MLQLFVLKKDVACRDDTEWVIFFTRGQSFGGRLDKQCVA